MAHSSQGNFNKRANACLQAWRALEYPKGLWRKEKFDLCLCAGWQQGDSGEGRLSQSSTIHLFQCVMVISNRNIWDGTVLTEKWIKIPLQTPHSHLKLQREFEMHSQCVPEMTEISAHVMVHPWVSPWPLRVFHWPWAQMEQVLGRLGLWCVPLELGA